MGPRSALPLTRVSTPTRRQFDAPCVHDEPQRLQPGSENLPTRKSPTATPLFSLDDSAILTSGRKVFLLISNL